MASQISMLIALLCGERERELDATVPPHGKGTLRFFVISPICVRLVRFRVYKSLRARRGEKRWTDRTCELSSLRSPASACRSCKSRRGSFQGIFLWAFN